jgi:hypothetical protein
MAKFYSPTEQGFFTTEVHTDFPLDCIEISDDLYNTLLAEQSLGKEIVYSTERGLEAIERPILWESIRYERNMLLTQSDWTQLPDIPESLRLKWSVYRQQLRDITVNFPSPELVEWPQLPV